MSEELRRDGSHDGNDDQSSKSQQHCKMFIGGLHLQTTTETLKEFFSQWGTITDAIVMRDPGTKRSRGFGFVTYDNPQSVDDCLSARPHNIDGREVEAKRAVPREENSPTAHTRTKKVFLGGLSLDTTEQDIRDVLGQHGTVVDVQIMRDKISEKPRGFGFAIFEDCDVVDKLSIKKYHRIKDRDVEVKKAISQEDMRKQDMTKQQQHTRYFQPRDPYGRDPYSTYRAYGGAYGDYRAMGGYDYSRYPQADQYMRAADSYMNSGFSMGGGYGDRNAATAAAYAAAGYQQSYGRGYDMSAYANMYAGAAGQGMGTYPQVGSTYGPARGYVDPTRERDRGASSRAYHPYKR